MPKKQTVSERIRRAVETADVTRYRIAQETGLEESALSRFVSRERGLSMEALDALAEFFEMQRAESPHELDAHAKRGGGVRNCRRSSVSLERRFS
jgi:transcriptional regulator with XRE-family HTH domain